MAGFVINKLFLWYYNLQSENPGYLLLLLFLPLVFFGHVFFLRFALDLNPIVFSVLAFLFLLYFIRTSGSKLSALSYHLDDMAFLLFISWSFLSFFWATDPSKTVYLSLAWGTLFVYLQILRTVNFGPTTKKNITVFFSIIFLLLLISTLTLGFEKSNIYTSFLKIHRNKAASNLVCIFPFIFFSLKNSKFHLILKIALVSLVSVVLIQTNCRGGILALAAILSIYFFSRNIFFSQKKIWLGSLSFVALLLVMLTIPAVRDLISSIRIIQEFLDTNELDRFYMIRNTLWLFYENPITGVGSGNWGLEAYKFGYSDFSQSKDNFSFGRLYVHNLYAQILGELGIVGFLSLMYVLITPLVTAFRKLKNLSNFDLAICSAIVAFLISSLFYSSAILCFGSYSPMVLIVMFGLAYLKKSHQLTKGLQLYPFFIKLVLPVMLSLCLVFFIFYLCNEHKLTALQKHKDDSELYIQEMENLYYSKLKTNFENKSIPYLLAYTSRATKNNPRTERYYDQAISIDPYDVNIMASYAEDLLERLNRPEKAEKIALRAFKVFDSHFKTKLVLAKIAYAKGAYEDASAYLSFVRDHEEQYNKFMAGLDKEKRVKFLSQSRKYSNPLLAEAKELKEKIDAILQK